MTPTRAPGSGPRDLADDAPVGCALFGCIEVEKMTYFEAFEQVHCRRLRHRHATDDEKLQCLILALAAIRAKPEGSS